jgi:hypothetical protein
MPDFQITGPDGGRYKITAPDESSALQAFQAMSGGQPDVAAPSAPEPAAGKGPSVIDKAIEPITSYPETYQQMNRESVDQMATGVGQLTGDKSTGGWAEENLGKTAAGLGNVAMGGIGYVASPITAALRTVVGKPIEENTGIPKEYSEFAASLAIPGLGLRSAVPAPAVRPAGVRPPAAPVNEIAEAAARQGITMPRAAVTESIPLQATAGAVKEMPLVGTPLVKASRQSAEEIENAVSRTAAEYGTGSTFAGGQAAKGGIENWITSKSGAISDRLYGAVDKYVNPTVASPLTETQRAAQDIIARNAMSKLPEGKARVGELLDTGILPEGMSGAELKQIYGALTKDLRASVKNAGGPEGLRAFDTANDLHRQISEKRAALAKIIGTKADAPPETVLSRIWSMASGKNGADISRLLQARKSMGAENWNEMTASIIDRMGRTAQDAEFSGDRFVTAWNNLSGQGRKLLFSSTGKDSAAKAVEDLVTISNAYKRLKEFSNPSGTGRTVTVGGMLGMAWVEPISMLTGALGGHVFARMMARPVTATPARNWAQTYVVAARAPNNPVAQAALAKSSAALAEKAGQQLGIDPARILQQLQGAIPAPAGEQPEQPQ